MDDFSKTAAKRIFLACLVFAMVASPLSWLLFKENIEESIVSAAMEESKRLIYFQHAENQAAKDARQHAEKAANILVGGMFEIAEIYSAEGVKVAAAETEAGKRLESLLPKHQAPRYSTAHYENHSVDGKWLIRVFAPLYSEENKGISAYFEGIQVIPDWQQEQMLHDALLVAFFVAVAAFMSGLLIYPLVVYLSSDNRAKAKQVLESHIAMMESLGRSIAKRDSDTGAHNYRVAWIACLIGEQMGVAGQKMQSLIIGSFLHDAGKIGIPDAILLKPGKLDPEEFDIMKTHVQQGVEIVDGISWFDEAKDVVASHHEKWNGSGYPAGLKAETIPLSARIFAVADVFDALCSKRPYKDPMPYPQVMGILHEASGSHFDPAVIQVFSPMSDAIFRRLEGISEKDARNLLESSIKRYFDV